MARSLKNPSWRPFPAAYEPGTYTRVGVQSLSDKELAKEYSRVRREAQERLRSFQRSKDPELRSASVVAEKAGLYLNRAQIKQVTSSAAEARGMMEDLLIDAYRFVSAKTSSLSGYKRTRSKQVASLQAAGYDFIDESNIRWFGQFMDYARERKYFKTFGSKQFGKALNEAAKQQISSRELKRHFKFYVEQVQKYGEISKYKPAKG